jgi:hypothetical protein
MAKGNSGMRRGGNAGGGIASNKNVNVGVRKGGPATGVRPGAVSQWGSAIGNKATDAGKLTYRGEKYATATPISVPLGNEVALNVKGGGPGAGREVTRSGSQGVHGPVAGTSKPQGREILREFGPDSAIVRNRR